MISPVSVSASRLISASHSGQVAVDISISFQVW
jgi:hypothetical protein